MSLDAIADKYLVTRAEETDKKLLGEERHGW